MKMLSGRCTRPAAMRPSRHTPWKREPAFLRPSAREGQQPAQLGPAMTVSVHLAIYGVEKTAGKQRITS